ncbi:MAG: GAF domain-containing protein, partial [Bacteroidetes bacterium]
MKTDKDPAVAIYAKTLLQEVEQFPILKEGFEDLTLIKKYREPIDKLSRVLFPDSLLSNEIKALIPPFMFEPIYSSTRFDSIIKTSDFDFSLYLKDTSADQFYQQSCYFILADYFGYPIRINRPMLIEVENKEQEVMRTYRMTINGDLIEHIPTDKAVDITRKDFEELLDNYNDIELWKKKFPPNSWIMRGVFIVNLVDVTIDQSLSTITSNLLNRPSDSFENIKKGLRSLFNNNCIETGMVTFQENELMPVHKNDVESIILDKNCSLDCKDHVSSETFKKLIEKRHPLVVSDVDLYTKNNPTPISMLLKKTPWKSYIMAPLIHEDELLGFMELASKKKYELNSLSLKKLNQILPVLALATKRYKTEAQNKIEAIIQQECTTVHHSVKWRFEQEAQKFITKQYEGEDPVFSDIIFPEVYPLYGQLDIKNSSNRRNEAVAKDLIKQINGVKQILTLAFQLTNMPAYEELLFRLETYKAELEDGLTAGSGHKIVELLKSEVYPVFSHLQQIDTELNKLIVNYNSKLDPNLNTLYEERRKFDDSVNLINQKLASYLDNKQLEAQKMFPHYFERYKTDGVEYNIYIGQSISKEKQFDPIHLRDLRLWQLMVMVEMENEFASLQQELELPVEIASLILVYNTSLSIHFRMDEKRFDVEGAYNARYEIIKKRIDKAHIKGTKERITRPGSIAIVYSQEEDAIEYKKYL